MAEEEDEREEELSTLTAIFPELATDPDDPFSATLELAISPSKPLLIRFLPSQSPEHPSYAQATANGGPHVEHDVELSHLPPITLQITLPDGYPSTAPPQASLQTQLDWLPKEKLSEMEQEAARIWEEYGRCQILYVYIDYLQSYAESGFGLDQSASGCLVLEAAREKDLVAFDADTKLAIFKAGTYDCGICLEPEKGLSCHSMKKCGHVFCLQCLQDFYNNAITEGDIVNVRCLDPGCAKEQAKQRADKGKPKKERTLYARELLDMGIDEPNVRRYLELKRKKKLESDKNTVYCPRTWCQGPARKPNNPPIPADLAKYAATEPDSSDDEASDTADGHSGGDRLSVCEKCTFAFCRVCYMGWHGDFARCYPRDPNELSVEEKASYDYIRMNTSPCPTCNSPTQKTMGCNHMKCFQCNSHFCYLCGAWLDGDNPYIHYNRGGSDCYQRLWELEEGDEGQVPGDGRGFAGGRGWEQMAIDVARQADADEAEAAAQAEVARVQAEEDERAAHALADDEGDVLRHVVAQLRLNGQAMPAEEQQPIPQEPAAPRRAIRRPRNPFAAHPPAAHGAAPAVRNHERGGARARPQLQPERNIAERNGERRRRNPQVDAEERRRQELQRFLEMARRDEEDGWDSDELGDEAGFEIR